MEKGKDTPSLQLKDAFAFSPFIILSFTDLSSKALFPYFPLSP